MNDTTWFGDHVEAFEPVDRAAVAHWLEEYRNAIVTLCAWGYCTVETSSTTGKVIGGMGPVECPCDHLPGWKSQYAAGQPKPAVPVKARGRHGSRVQRSRRRHRGLVGPQLVNVFGEVR